MIDLHLHLTEFDFKADNEATFNFKIEYPDEHHKECDYYIDDGIPTYVTSRNGCVIDCGNNPLSINNGVHMRTIIDTINATQLEYKIIVVLYEDDTVFTLPVRISKGVSVNGMELIGVLHTSFYGNHENARPAKLFLKWRDSDGNSACTFTYVPSEHFDARMYGAEELLN